AIRIMASASVNLRSLRISRSSSASASDRGFFWSSLMGIPPPALRLNGTADRSVSASLRYPEHVDRLILLSTAGRLTGFGAVRDGDQGVAGQPRDPFDVAVALARKAIDGLRPRHHGIGVLIDASHPQAGRRL